MQVDDQIMFPVAMHFASGNSLVTGLAMLCIAYGLLLSRHRPPRGALLAVRLLAFLGMAFVVLATVPLHSAIWIAMGLGVLPLLAGQVKWLPIARLGALALAVGAVSAVWSEYLWASARLPRAAARLPIIVLGDSLSAAETDPTLTAWPAVLEERGWSVQNLAGIGATAASALRKAEPADTSNAIVLLVIGGNDLLGSTDPASFEASLDALVRRVTGEGTEVVLFELPLPPLKFEWGRIQRRIAAKYGCRLVTRRVIAAVLAGHENTVDGIHLSQKGHDTMARLVIQEVLPTR